MSNEDSELERLKAKRLAEMQQNISTRQEIEKPTNSLSPKETKHPRDILVEHLGFRGLEVLRNAELQFTNDTIFPAATASIGGHRDICPGVLQVRVAVPRQLHPASKSPQDCMQSYFTDHH